MLFLSPPFDLEAPEAPWEPDLEGAVLPPPPPPPPPSTATFALFFCLGLEAAEALLFFTSCGVESGGGDFLPEAGGGDALEGRGTLVLEIDKYNNEDELAGKYAKAQSTEREIEKDAQSKEVTAKKIILTASVLRVGLSTGSGLRGARWLFQALWPHITNKKVSRKVTEGA